MEALQVAKEEACKASEEKLAEIEGLNEDHKSTLSRLAEAHAAEVSKCKEDHAAEVSKLCDDHATEILGLREKHDSNLVDKRTHGFNEAMDKAARDIQVVKDCIYKKGYEFGLESASLSRDHKLYDKTVLCPAWGFYTFVVI